MSKVAHTTHGVIDKVIHRNGYVCSVCGEPMSTTIGFSGLQCQKGHKIGKRIEGEQVSATTHQSKDKT